MKELTKDLALLYLEKLLDKLNSSDDIFLSFDDFSQGFYLKHKQLPKFRLISSIYPIGKNKNKLYIRILEDRFDVSEEEYVNISKIIMDRKKQLEESEVGMNSIEGVFELLEKENI